MPEQRHFIKKTTLNLSVHEEGKAFEIQQTCRAALLDRALPMLDRLFAETCPDDRWLQIEALEVDLGDLPMTNLAAAFEEQLLKKLKEALRPGQNGHTVPSFANATPDYFTATVYPPGAAPGAPVRLVDKKFSTVRESILERWLHFLESGFFDWLGEPQSEGQALESVLLETARGWHAQQWIYLEQFIGSRPAAFVRLLLGFSPEKWLDWIKLWQAAYEERGLSVEKTIISGVNRLATEPKLVLTFGPRIAERLSLAFPATDWTSIFSEKEKKKTREVSPHHLNGKADAEQPVGNSIAELGLSGPSPKATSQPFSPDMAAGEEPIVIGNGGLVLMHPFIPSLFAQTGLLREEKFVDENARQKALALLHYLGSGETRAPEYALPLCKVLCDYPLQMPTDPDLMPGEAEIAEANTCLAAAIEHWNALGSTSPDGLREGFLRRPGKLIARPEGGWLLQVEPKALDVLLNRLPWGVGIVRLPWMPEFLMVEWIY